MQKINYLQKAVKEAWKYQFLTYPNPAVGAAIVKDNKIISCQAHKEAGLPHAEVNAIKEAFLYFYPNSKLQNLTTSLDIHQFLIQNHNNIFKDCEIYVTLEPCNHIGKTPSCANLLKILEFKKVYIGTTDPNPIATGGIETLQNSGIEVEVLNDKASQDLLIPFIKWQQSNFKFFKLAIREDGSCDGGYITTQQSLNLVHQIRTKLDLLIIGGNTVRIDRPTLDSRFSHTKKAPNILIYSTKQDFDKTIPLFNIPNRTVTISSDIEHLKEKFIMIEGGYNLLTKLTTKIDMLMLFVSHKNNKKLTYKIPNNFSKVHSYFINQTDEISFYLA